MNIDKGLYASPAASDTQGTPALAPVLTAALRWDLDPPGSGAARGTSWSGGGRAPDLHACYDEWLPARQALGGVPGWWAPD